MTDEESTRLAAIKTDIAKDREELRQLEEELSAKAQSINVKPQKSQEMEKKSFSLLSAIRSELNREKQSPENQAVIEAGREELRQSGKECLGTIAIPTERRDTGALDVATEGTDIVPTDIMDLKGPLYAKSTLVQSGVNFLSGLTGNVKYPVLSASTAAWEGETETNADSVPTIAGVDLTPHRLAVTVPISRQFLLQTSPSAEAAVRRMITDTIMEKVEKTILGKVTSTPINGLFSGTVTTITDWSGILALEAAIEAANMEGYSYIITPALKAELRNMIKGGTTTSSGGTTAAPTYAATVNCGGMVMENGEIDGVKTLVTSAIDTAKGGIVADFSQMVLANWGGIDLIVDPYTLSNDGCVRLVANTYWDFKALRSNCYKTFKK